MPSSGPASRGHCGPARCCTFWARTWPATRWRWRRWRCWARRCTRPARDALALLLAWPLGTLALLAWPAVGGYYGLSGPVHAAAAILALRALQAPATRWLGLLLAGGLLIKLALERGWAVPVGFDSGWGFNVVFAAHLSSAAVGAALALALQVVGLLASPRRHAPPASTRF